MKGKQNGEVSMKSSKFQLVRLSDAPSGSRRGMKSQKWARGTGTDLETRHPCLAGREQRLAGKELPAPRLTLLAPTPQ